jgi:hypothetical protein
MSRTSPVPFTLQEGLHCERGAAKIFGTDCAIVLQRFIWWTYPNKSKFGTLDENGNKWVYFTMDDLVDEFDWLSKSTLWRIINLLEENHILLSKQPEGKASRRKHYSISWPMWLKIQSGAYSKIGKDGKLIPSQIDGIPSGQIEEVGSLQIEGMGSIQIEAFPYNLELPRTHLEKEPSAPSRYLQPDKEDIEVASLKAAPSPKAEGAPSSASPRKPHLHWEVAYGVEMPESLRTENCLAAVKLWLQHMTERRKSYKPTGLTMALSKWSNQFTAASFPMAVEDSIAANYAGIFPSKAQQQPFQSSPQKPKPAWLQIKELEARIESHVANHNRLGYDSSKSTPEAKEEWKRMKQALKDLQAGQPQAEEGSIP